MQPEQTQTTQALEKAANASPDLRLGASLHRTNMQETN